MECILSHRKMMDPANEHYVPDDVDKNADNMEKVQIKLQEMGVPKLNVSYKPQKISPKFEGTVRQLLHAKWVYFCHSVANCLCVTNCSHVTHCRKHFCLSVTDCFFTNCFCVTNCSYVTNCQKHSCLSVTDYRENLAQGRGHRVPAAAPNMSISLSFCDGSLSFWIHVSNRLSVTNCLSVTKYQERFASVRGHRETDAK